MQGLLGVNTTSWWPTIDSHECLGSLLLEWLWGFNKTNYGGT